MVGSAIIVGKVIKRPEDDYTNLHCRENLGPCVFKRAWSFQLLTIL